MEGIIKELKFSIDYHQRKAKKINNAMWIIIILAVFFHFFISVLLDSHINKLLISIQFAIENGVKSNSFEPTEIARSMNKNYLGMVVLGMCAARLVVYIGELKFHLGEISRREETMFSILTVEIIKSESLSHSSQEVLLKAVHKEGRNNEPSLHLPSEAIKKITDSIAEKVTTLISSKGSQ